MVKLTIKNLINCCNQDKNSRFLINSIIEKTKKDSDFEKFITFIIKYNISIFEKNVDWFIIDKEQIEFNVNKIIETTFNDHIINITQISNNNLSINEIKITLDKLNTNLKKKLGDLYEIKNLLEILDLDIKCSKNKKIINNDIYIEEFSN